MLERENIVAELHQRLNAVEGVKYTARNPRVSPKVLDCPLIQLFEVGEVTDSSTMRGKLPVYKKTMKIVVEGFVKSDSEGATSPSAIDFMKKIKRSIYKDGATLGGLCDLREIEASSLLRPPTGDTTSGLGIVLEIRYIEDISLLFG